MDSTEKAGNAAGREAERASILKALPWKAISKRKHQLYTRGRPMMKTKIEREYRSYHEQLELVFTSVGHLIIKEMLKRCQ